MSLGGDPEAATGISLDGANGNAFFSGTVTGTTVVADSFCLTSDLPCITSWPSGWAGIPGGSNTNVQFNDNGSFSGTSNLIWTSGKLSINNNNQPVYPVSIHGTIGTTEGVYFGNVTVWLMLLWYTWSKIWLSGATDLYIKWWNDWGSGITWSNVYIDGWDGTDHTVADGNVILVKDTANVGIGTNNPTEKVQVENYAQIGSNTQCVDDGSEEIWWYFLRLYDGSRSNVCFGSGQNKTTPNIQLNTSNYNWMIDGGNSLRFTFATGAFAYQEFMRISSGGNVGIGTNNPNQELEVNGNMRLTTAGYIEAGNNSNQLFLDWNGSIAIGTNNTNSSKVYIQASAQDDDYAKALTIIASDMTAPAEQHLVQTIGQWMSNGNAWQMSFVYLWNNNPLNRISFGFRNSNADMFNIVNNGNVWIWTITPSLKLEVAWWIKATGWVQVGKEWDNTRCNTTGDVGKFVYYNRCQDVWLNRIYEPTFAWCLGSGSSDVMKKTFLTWASRSVAWGCSTAEAEDIWSFIIMH